MSASAVTPGTSEPALQVDEPLQYLTFLAAQEMYAVNTLSVREIIEYNQVTTVPMMPLFLRGVINLRGSVVLDSVSEVIEILDIDIKPAPAFGNHIRTDFIRGMIKVRGEFVTLLQIEHVLCVDEMAGLM